MLSRSPGCSTRLFELLKGLVKNWWASDTSLKDNAMEASDATNSFVRNHAGVSDQVQHLFPASGDIHRLDGFPIPVCRNCRGTRCRSFRDGAAWGYCATKTEYFYGLRGHRVITLAGTAVAFTVTAANIDDRDVVPNLSGTIRGLLIGDKG